MTVEQICKEKYPDIATDGQTACFNQQIEKLEKRIVDLEKIVENLVNQSKE